MQSSTQNGPFLVFPGGECVPIDGPLRAELLRDGWYVIGENSTVACGSEAAARDTLARLIAEQDPNTLAREAMEEVERDQSFRSTKDPPREGR